MSVRDVIKNSVLESGAYMTMNMRELLVHLLAALLFGVLIYLVYRRFYQGVIFSRSFGITIVGMTVLTCMVTLAISTNVVISLGMVGALSIVRFRTAVKDPLDLLYLFWAITTGITAGAGMYILCAAAWIIMFVMVLLFQLRKGARLVYVLVIHYTGEGTYDEILRSFGRIRRFVKSVTMRGNKNEMVAEVMLRKEDFDLPERLKAIGGVEDVTLIQYNGEYHG